MATATEINHRDPVPFRKLPPVIESMTGVRLSHTTPWRWSRRGVRGHRLATVTVNNVECVELTELARFLSVCATPSK